MSSADAELRTGIILFALGIIASLAGFFLRRLIKQIDSNNQERQQNLKESQTDIKTKIDIVGSKLDKFDDSVWEVIRDHSKRIKRLERAREKYHGDIRK